MTTNYVDNKQYVYEVVVWDDIPVCPDNTHPYYDNSFSGVYRNLNLERANEIYDESVEQYDHVQFVQVLVEKTILKSK